MPHARRPYRLSPRAAGAALVLAVLLTTARPPVRAQTDAAIVPTLVEDALAREFTLDGTGTWAIRNGVLGLVVAGKPAGTIRRPSALAIVNGPELAAATLEVELRSTAALPAVTPRRDALLVAGYQSPTRFYYVHLSAIRDDVHNGIFLVNDADRRRIDTTSAVAPLVDQAWHTVRLVRTPSTGRLDVYVDGHAAPIMSAVDTTLRTGRMGVGSFDDTAEFRRIRITTTR